MENIEEKVEAVETAPKAEKPAKVEKAEKTEHPLAQKYDNMDEKAPPKKSKKAPKKKVCPFCTEKGRVIDYKEAQKLKRYITEKGKIIPRRSNGLCALHQREVAQAIKRARTMALLPFKAE